MKAKENMWNQLKKNSMIQLSWLQFWKHFMFFILVFQWHWKHSIFKLWFKIGQLMHNIIFARSRWELQGSVEARKNESVACLTRTNSVLIHPVAKHTLCCSSTKWSPWSGWTDMFAPLQLVIAQVTRKRKLKHFFIQAIEGTRRRNKCPSSHTAKQLLIFLFPGCDAVNFQAQSETSTDSNNNKNLSDKERKKNKMKNQKTNAEFLSSSQPTIMQVTFSNVTMQILQCANL